MNERLWILKNCRFAQQQNFDFYNPAEYQPEKSPQETQDKQFWAWVKTDNNPTRLDPIESLKEVDGAIPKQYLSIYHDQRTV